MVKQYLLHIGDPVKIYLHDYTIEGIFTGECGIGITLSDEKQKGTYLIVPIEVIQYMEYKRCVKK